MKGPDGFVCQRSTNSTTQRAGKSIEKYTQDTTSVHKYVGIRDLYQHGLKFQFSFDASESSEQIIDSMSSLTIPRAVPAMCRVG